MSLLPQAILWKLALAKFLMAFFFSVLNDSVCRAGARVGHRCSQPGVGGNERTPWHQSVKESKAEGLSSCTEI